MRHSPESRMLLFLKPPSKFLRSSLLAAIILWIALPESFGAVQLTWLVTLDHQKTVIEQLAEDFEANNPDINIRLLWVPANQYSVKFKTLAAARQTPDLFYCGDVWLAGQLPFLFDLTPFIERDREELNLKDFPPNLLEASRKDGKWFLLPRFFNVSLLYYNRTLFRKEEVDFPSPSWTWADYLEAARQLTKRNERGQTEWWGSDVVLGWWGEWLTLVRQGGGDFLAPDVSEARLNEAEALVGLQFYYDKVYKHRIAPAPGRGPGTGFPSGRFGMQWGGHLGNWTVYNDFPNLDWDVEILPSGPTGTAGGELAIESYGIFKETRHPEEAWRLLKYIVSVEAVRPFAERGFLPARLPLAEEVYGSQGDQARPRNWQAAYRALEHARPIPFHPHFLELALDIVQPEMDLMMSNRLTPEEAALRATRAANAFIKTVSYRQRNHSK